MLTIINTKDDLSETVWAAAKIVQVNYSEILKTIIDLMNAHPIDKQTLAWEIFQINDPFAQNLLKALEKSDVNFLLN